MSEMSPRQRMINMMYLVLTALLALNVSKQVLDAFQKMDGCANSHGKSQPAAAEDLYANHLPIQIQIISCLSFAQVLDPFGWNPRFRIAQERSLL